MILGTTGRPVIGFGGEEAHKQFTKGDIVCSLQWVDLGSDDGPEPVAAIYPTSRRMDSGAYVVPQANAHAFFSRDGNPTLHLMDCAVKAAHHIGSFPDRSTVYRIADILTEAAPDLVRMPTSLPESVAAAIRKEKGKNVMGIEATASVNGKVVKEILL